MLVLAGPGQALLISFSHPEIRDRTMLGLGPALDSLGVRLTISVFSFSQMSHPETIFIHPEVVVVGHLGPTPLGNP